MDLIDQLESINSHQDLAAFIRNLLLDLRDDPDAWENVNLEHYLGALAAWVGSMDGYFMNLGKSVPAAPTWQLIGDMLYAAKIYE